MIVKPLNQVLMNSSIYKLNFLGNFIAPNSFCKFLYNFHTDNYYV